MNKRKTFYTIQKIWPIFLTQIFTATAVGLNLTVAALATVNITGRDDLGGLAQSSIIFGAAIITTITTKISYSKDRLFSFRLSLILSGFGAFICFLASSFNEIKWIFFLGLILLGGGTVGALLSRFVAAEKVRNTRISPSSAIGIILFGSAIGSAIGPNIYSLVSRLTGGSFGPIFLISATVFASGLVPLCFERRENYRNNSPKETIKSGEKHEWKPIFYTIFSIGIASHAIMICLMSMAPVHTDRLFDSARSGAAMTAHLLGMYAFGPLIGSLTNRFKANQIILANIFLFILSVSLLTFFNTHFILFMFGIFGIGVAWSMGIILSSSLMTKIEDSGQRIYFQGRFDLSINIAAGITSIISGLIVSRFGYTGLSLSILVILCIALIIFLSKGKSIISITEL